MIIFTEKEAKKYFTFDVLCKSSKLNRNQQVMPTKFKRMTVN